MKQAISRKTLIFTVTNDLTYDQRMIRICTSLAAAGYNVMLVGRKLPSSLPISKTSFQQKRLTCFFKEGFLFYAEFNIRLLFFLLFKKADLVCAIDLDTILPVFIVTAIKGSIRVYDAHELFCEMKEVANRPGVYRKWKLIERFAVPHFRNGYTVNESIAAEFKKLYRSEYRIVRNIPTLKPLAAPTSTEKYILYQGAVNEGRSFETLIPAFTMIDLPLVICGDGNFMKQARDLAAKHELQHKVLFKGKVVPSELENYTRNATLGVTLFDDAGLSNYYSLANRFFDYMHAGVPQICVDFPVYRAIINQYSFGILIKDLSSQNIAKQVNSLLSDLPLYRQLQQNCLSARNVFNWQQEEKVLIEFYRETLSV